MQEFRSLEIWKRAHALVLDLYRDTTEFPNHEGFGLTMQICRAGTATAARIAEACGRDLDTEFAADLRRAKTSATELEYLLMVARDLGYWQPKVYERLNESAVTLRKMIHGHARKL